VLVVEDEMKLASLIQKALREQGMLADTVVRGEDALWMAAATPFDVVVLDVNLPGIDGFETVRRLRGAGIRTPVLMLTARDGVDDRIAGLDTGADDYVVKPFDFGELFARIRAMARRGPVDRAPVQLSSGSGPAGTSWTPVPGFCRPRCSAIALTVAASEVARAQWRRRACPVRASRLREAVRVEPRTGPARGYGGGVVARRV